jgi:NitT/TauT family transport system ATP-binding protein
VTAAVERPGETRRPAGPAGPAPVQIECEGLAKVFGDPGRGGQAVVALRDVSFQVRAGEFVVLLGPSGCGKSTLLNIVAGFERATRGEIRLDGEAIGAPGPDRGVVFQDYALFPWLTVRENIEYGLREKGLPRRQRLETCRRYIELVGLGGFEGRYPHQLSGGMQQRVAISRALAIDPKMLLMDEPFGALDAQTRRLLQQELLRVWQATHKTVIFVTHSVDEAIFLGQKVVVMTARPGSIKEVIEVGLPYPRDLTGEDFNVYRRRVTRSIEEEVDKMLRSGVAL